LSLVYKTVLNTTLLLGYVRTAKHLYEEISVTLLWAYSS